LVGGDAAHEFVGVVGGGAVQGQNTPIRSHRHHRPAELGDGGLPQAVDVLLEGQVDRGLNRVSGNRHSGQRRGLLPDHPSPRIHFDEPHPILATQDRIVSRLQAILPDHGAQARPGKRLRAEFAFRDLPHISDHVSHRSPRGVTAPRFGLHHETGKGDPVLLQAGYQIKGGASEHQRRLVGSAPVPGQHLRHGPAVERHELLEPIKHRPEGVQ